ncbi:Uncharacterized protein Fot_17821 [Forsythia ovata]|uniref:Uncharacterized protein n=1 Tax=Forsythia ovata TaxID=205694 RepID=A0ABD1VGF8_9LAMI
MKHSKPYRTSGKVVVTEEGEHDILTSRSAKPVCLSGLQDLSQQEQHEMKLQKQTQLQSLTIGGSKTRNTSVISHASSQRFKRRKNNSKRVCHLPAETEHNHPIPTHRNSLAGSTRQKPVTPNKPSCSPPLENLESSREEIEDMAEVEDEDDDFFKGLEEVTGPVNGDCLSDYFPTVVQFPWLANNATTTAAGSG